MNAIALKVGMAGLGRMGARHARNLATRVPGAELVAANSPVADERAWARRELGVDAGSTPTIARCSPTASSTRCSSRRRRCEHAEQIIAALEAGKHVFSEKPTSLNLEECLRVEEVAQSIRS